MSQECGKIWDEIKNKRYIIIYGAGNIAKAVFWMLSSFVIHVPVFRFCVSEKQDNPDNICGIPVCTPDELTDYYQDSVILLAATNNQDSMIMRLAEFTVIKPYSCGYKEPLWDFLYTKYATCLLNNFGGDFQVIKPGNCVQTKNMVSVFQIHSHHDKALDGKIPAPHWMKPLQAGKAMTDIQLCELCDNTGEQISYKNDRYCELTGMYWIWKNCKDFYKGICHYRRCPDIFDENSIIACHADVILPKPVITTESLEMGYFKAHLPEDWDVMLSVLKELYPDYYSAAEIIFQEVLFYPGNIVIAKAEYFDSFCRWLFSILFEVEKRTVPKADAYQNRYLGFLAERLTTLYFVYNKGAIKIVHTNLLLLT